MDSPKLGDIVKLGARSLPEHRGRPAIVTKVSESHCTVVVLDTTRRFGCGEAWPGFTDIELMDTFLRVGSRVVVQGMASAKRASMNGRAGSIVAHPREGHPSFLCKPSRPDPVLTVCVNLGGTLVLVEPCYLMLSEEFTKQAVLGLGNAAAALAPESQDVLEERAPALSETMHKPSVSSDLGDLLRWAMWSVVASMAAPPLEEADEDLQLWTAVADGFELQLLMM